MSLLHVKNKKAKIEIEIWPSLEPWNCSDANDSCRADGDAGLHRGLVFDIQQADLKRKHCWGWCSSTLPWQWFHSCVRESHLPHVAVAVAHPHLTAAIGAAVAGRGAGKLRMDDNGSGVNCLLSSGIVLRGALVSGISPAFHCGSSWWGWPSGTPGPTGPYS